MGQGGMEKGGMGWDMEGRGTLKEMYYTMYWYIHIHKLCIRYLLSCAGDRYDPEPRSRSEFSGGRSTRHADDGFSSKPYHDSPSNGDEEPSSKPFHDSSPFRE